MSREDYLKNVPFAPDWIVNPPPDIKKGSAERGNLEVALTHSVNEASSRARATLDKLSDELARESHGGRNDMLNRAAYTMGGHIATGAITRDEVEASLTMACHRNSLVADDGNAAVKKTIASGIGKGMVHPIYAEDAAIVEGDINGIEPISPAPRSELSLADLTRPPGLVGDIVDWIEASSSMPSREVALPAALGWVAALAGRGFETPRRARTNLYLVTVAPSGFGKDHPGACINSLASACGLDRFLGPARFMSASGLREALMGQPSVLCINDEFGGFLREIDGPKVGIHSALIRTDLMQLFSRAKDFYAGAAYAGSNAVRLYNPNLVMLGMSTPSDFWSAVSSARTFDGFLARFLIFNVTAKKPGLTTPTADEAVPPARLIKASQDLYSNVYGGGNLVAPLSSGANKFTAKRVNVTEDAAAAVNAFYVRTQAAKVTGEDQRESFLDRAAEHAWKLALTVAVGVDPRSPEIDLSIMQWGIDLAWLATCSMIEEADARIADNERQRTFKRIVDIIRKAGSEGITMSRIAKRLAGSVPLALRDEIIKDAQQGGEIQLRRNATTSVGGRPSERYVHREFMV